MDNLDISDDDIDVFISQISDNKQPDKLNKNIKKIKNLVLSGGSVGGIAHIGAIKYMHDNNLLDNLKSVAGSSIGALFGYMIILNIDIDALWDFILKVDTSKISDISWNLLWTDYGLDNGQKIINFLLDITHKITGIKNITFLELYNFNKKKFIVTGTIINKYKSVLFDYERTPNMSVIDAVRISISFPPYFTPYKIDDNYYIDGSALNNYPIDQFENELDDTIGIIINWYQDSEIKYLEDYCFNLINILFYKVLVNDVNKYPDHTIIINSQKKITTSFSIDYDAKLSFYNNGYASAKKYFEK
jgi:predicted acylesterase/phospholipase RssA